MNHLQQFRSITTFILDIDGVLTDGMMLLHQDNLLLRSMSVRDGFAMRVAVQSGYRLAIISGGDTPTAIDRLNKLGVQDVVMDCTDKVAALNDLVKKYDLQNEELLYMGDDLPDFDPMKMVGLPCCPQDAVDEIRDISVYVSSKKGGQGCVRDVIEKVLKLRGDWPGYPNLSA